MARWERLIAALEMACQLHGEQRRKTTGVSYLGHLLVTAGTVLDDGGDEDEAIAALLHDAIEDQGGTTTRAAIRSRFGDHVTAIVDGCSDTDAAEKPPWRERKEAHLAHLAAAGPEVRRVVTADKLHNLRALVRDYRRDGEVLWEHFRGGRDGTLWYYREATQILASGAPSELAGELERTFAELERLVIERAADT